MRQSPRYTGEKMSRIEDEVCEKIQARAAVGLEKYGTTMEREDFSLLVWLEYAQEEAMDFVVYLERLIDIEKKKEIDRGKIMKERERYVNLQKKLYSISPIDIEAFKISGSKGEE